MSPHSHTTNRQGLAVSSYTMIGQPRLRQPDDLQLSLPETHHRASSGHRPAPLPPEHPLAYEEAVEASPPSRANPEFYAKMLKEFKEKLVMVHTHAPKPPKAAKPAKSPKKRSQNPSAVQNIMSPNPPLPPVRTHGAGTVPDLSYYRQPHAPLATNCAFCKMQLQTSLAYDAEESVVELRCGHIAHEMCMLMEMQFIQVQPGSSEVFPECPECANDGRKMTATPRNAEEAQSIRSKLQQKKLAAQPPLTMPPPPRTLSKRPSLPAMSTFSPHRAIAKKPSYADFEKPTFGHAKKHSRGSSATAHFSTFSSASALSPSSPDFPTLGWTSGYALQDLRKKFVNELVLLAATEVIRGDESEVRLSKSLVGSFGELRLFDKMSVSPDSKTWVEHYCYLFEHAMVTFGANDRLFSIIPITPLMSVDTPSRWWVSLTSGSRPALYLSSSKTEILEKWTSALVNDSAYFAVQLMTSTIKEDEFAALILKGAQQANHSDLNGIQRPDPRFYESTLKSLVNRDKPDSMLIVLNQRSTSNDSLVAITNMLKSLLLVNISITLALCSTARPTLHSPVIKKYRLERKECLGNDELLQSRLATYHKMIRHQTFDQPDDGQYELGTFIDRSLRRHSSTALVMLSNVPLDSFRSPEGLETILVEVNSKSGDSAEKRTDVVRLISWEEVMEVICSRCGLEFDDSDFGFSDDDDDDDD